MQITVIPSVSLLFKMEVKQGLPDLFMKTNQRIKDL